MKAKEYFLKFQTENQDKSPEWRLIKSLNEMILEVKTISEQRRAVLDSAVIAIFKEQEKKSLAFIKLVNETEPFKSEGEVLPDAFKLYVLQTTPYLHNLVWK
jgi:hypothetical protein